MPRSSSDSESQRGSVRRGRSSRNRNAISKSKSSAAMRRNALANEAGTYKPPVECCAQRCGQIIPFQQSRGLRRSFCAGKTQVHRKRLLIGLVADRNALDDRDSDSGSSSKNKPVFQYHGIVVCRSYMRSVTTASPDLLNSVLGTPHAPSSPYANRRARSLDGSKHTLVAAYLLGVKSRDADHSPERDVFHLPQRNKIEVWEDYCEQERALGRLPCGYTHFVRTWKEVAPEIKTRRLHGFARCDTCVEFDEDLDGPLTAEQREDTLRRRSEHIQFVRASRAMYYATRDEAQLRPDRTISLIVDGADQVKYALPHFASKSKASSIGLGIPIHLIGVLNHGGKSAGAGAFLFTAEDYNLTGSNLVVEVIHRVITSESNRLQALDLILPPVLFVQLDNCTRENKNSFTHGYFELLVVRGVFKKVVARYLPKGHTHEDIDQMFSRTGAGIRDKNICTIPELHAALGESFTPQPIISHIDSTINTKALFEVNRLLRPSSELSGFTVYHEFSFTVDAAGASTCEVKLWPISQSSVSLLSSGLPGGFLRPGLSLDLRKMTIPPLVRKKSTTEDAHRMTRRIQAVERRIGSQASMEALRTLIARLTLGGEVPCPWNLSTCPEMNGHYTRDAVYMRERLPDGRCGESLSPGSEDEEPDFDMDEIPIAGVEYNVGDLVVVRPHVTQLKFGRFWIGAIVKRKKTNPVPGQEQRIAVLWVQWMEPENGVAELTAKFCPAVGDADEIYVDSVLCKFPKLLRSGQLPVKVQKEISRTLVTCESRDAGG